MVVVEGRTMLELLPEEECWRRLAAAAVGRIAVVVDGAPEVYPVNFAVQDRTLVLRTDTGSKLRGLDRSPRVAIEIDGVDALSRTGWSVLVKGTASRITDPEEVRAAMALPLELWAPGMKTRWIRIRPTEVTGRAIRPRGGTGRPSDGGDRGHR